MIITGMAIGTLALFMAGLAVAIVAFLIYSIKLGIEGVLDKLRETEDYDD